MRRKSDSLRLTKSSTLNQAGFKRLRQEDETWEADFRALPPTATHYLGLVVTKRSGEMLAETQVDGRPSANDLAALLGKAMREPLTNGAHRPRRIHVRGHRQWQELISHLEQLGIQVSVKQELLRFRAAYQDRLRQMQEARRAGMVRPTKQQAQVEKLFPAIAQWVRGGHIEIGDQEGFGFVAMALDCGGVVCEDDRPRTLAEAMGALENRLSEWFEEQGIELKG